MKKKSFSKKVASKRKPRIVFLGSTRFSEELLLHVLALDVDVKAVFTIPEEFHISYDSQKVRNYNFSDLGKIAAKHGIRTYSVDSVPGTKLADYEEVIRKLKPDVILVLGWYYMVPRKIRDMAVYGAWGIHASLLPDYAGGAPLVWAIINGEEKAGVTLFRLDDGVDDGDIIAQSAFPIKHEDTIKEVYKKATQASKRILSKVFNDIHSVQFKKQDKSKIKVYKQRNPDDGRIDLTGTSLEIYNFIRAQSSPYPGAFIRTKDGRKIIIEKARIG